MIYTKDKPLKIFTTFSGYDSQCLALKYSNIPFDLIGWSEIDKFAISAHDKLFPEYKDRNYGDISKIDWNNVPDFDFLTYSSPCQDISVAGGQKGLTKDSGTRSSLIWEIEKAIRIKRPKFLLMENVKAIVSDKFIDDFNSWLNLLSSYGYKNSWKVINAKYFVPQNRERCFCVSVLDAEEPFKFPKVFGEKKDISSMSSILEKNVDQKYYISKEKNKECLEKMNNKQLSLFDFQDEL